MRREPEWTCEGLTRSARADCASGSSSTLFYPAQEADRVVNFEPLAMGEPIPRILEVLYRRSEHSFHLRP